MKRNKCDFHQFCHQVIIEIFLFIISGTIRIKMKQVKKNNPPPFKRLKNFTYHSELMHALTMPRIHPVLRGFSSLIMSVNS